MWRFLRNERGQSIIELALAAPILIFVLVGGVDLMRVAAINQAVQNAARVGADLAVSNTAVCDDIAHPSAAACSAATITLWNTIVNELGGTPGVPTMNPLTETLCVASPPAAGSSPCMSPPPRSNTRYTGNTAGPMPTSCPVSVPGGLCFIEVRVEYTFKTIVPWPGMPQVITVDRSAFMPMVR